MSSSRTVPKANLSQLLRQPSPPASSSGRKECTIQRKSSIERLSSMDLKAEFSDLLSHKKNLGNNGQISRKQAPISLTSSASPDNHSAHTHFELGTGTGTCGLWNLGNTCYQNSTLQVLAGIPEMVDFFHSSQV